MEQSGTEEEACFLGKQSTLAKRKCKERKPSNHPHLQHEGNRIGYVYLMNEPSKDPADPNQHPHIFISALTSVINFRLA